MNIAGDKIPIIGYFICKSRNKPIIFNWMVGHIPRYWRSWSYYIHIHYFNLRKTGGWDSPPPWHKINFFFYIKTDFKDTETSWLPQFYPNESNGTKFSACFFIGMGLRAFFARNLLGENGYFIGFWHFRPNFELVLHTSKWLLCHQKVWKLFIYILVSIQHNL